MIERILNSNRHPEQGFRSCLWIMRPGQKYTATRMEAAARRAIALNVCSYQSVKSIFDACVYPRCDLAAGTRRVDCVQKLGVRLGNWLTAEQASTVLANTA